MKVGDRRTCKVCGTQVSASREICPVCMLRAAITEEASPEQPGSELALVGSNSEPAGTRFEKYELMLHPDGKPVELGRGAMALRGLQIWLSGGVQRQVEEVSAPAVNCLCFKALTEWHFGETDSCQATMAKAIPLAKELNDMPALAVALFFAAHLAHFEGNCAEVERLALDLIELSTRQNFAIWLPIGAILRGWARSASGDTDEGIMWIQDGIEDTRAAGAMVVLPYLLAGKAEALHLADRTSEALEAISEAEAVVERSGERWWCAEMHRLRAVFLAVLGAEETQIEASLCAAINTAKGQKSVSLGNAPKQPTRNIGGKKRVRQADVDSDCLFGNARSGNCVVLLLVLVLFNGRHVAIIVYYVRIRSMHVARNVGKRLLNAVKELFPIIYYCLRDVF